MNILGHLIIFSLVTLISLIGIKKSSYEEYFVALMIINIIYLIIVFGYMISSTFD